jgi:hypothetical protein
MIRTALLSIFFATAAVSADTGVPNDLIIRAIGAQQEFVRRLAEATAAIERCSGFEINKFQLQVALQEVGLTDADLTATYADFFADWTRNTRKFLAETYPAGSERDLCSTRMRDRYGSGGTGLMRNIVKAR